MKCNSRKLKINLYNYLQKIWSKKIILSYFLLPFSLLYRLVIFLRECLYRYGLKTVHHFDIPIIVVGNITVGGSGKTPLILYLADLLTAKGYHPAIVSRGYKSLAEKKTASNSFLVKKNDDVALVGDEALMIAKRTICPLAIGKKRSLSIKKILENNRCDLIISDDGLAHYSLGRDIEIAVIDGQKLFGNGFLLPAGFLRETKKRLKKVDFIVTTEGKKENLENAFKMIIETDYLYNLKNQNVQQTHEYFLNKTVHAVAGIGNPQRFFDTLKKLGIKFIEHSFPDHHWFISEELNFNDNNPIIMSEKDAMRCEKFAKDNFWVLRIKVKIEEEFTKKFLQKLSL